MFRIAVVIFPGTNCEGETMRSLMNAGLAAEYVRWNERERIPEFDGYVLPGGFAYEDRSRAGIVAAQDPIMQLIKAEAEKGKPVIGICNGCQVLVETGMIPGLNNNALAGAVAMNTRVRGGQIIGTGFYHDLVYIQNVAPINRSCVTMGLTPGTIIPATVANGEGRFIFPTELLLELEQHNQILFKYCTKDGVILNEFPTTPNGAIWGIAGLCNPQGNVVAYMPHPERHDTGVGLFVGLRQYLEQPPQHERYELTWQPPVDTIETYQATPGNMQLIVDLLITDNAAKTIQLNLQQQGFNVQVQRKTHWEILTVTPVEAASATTALVQTGELLNTNKETVTADYKATPNSLAFLVRYRDNFEGKAVADTLKTRFNLDWISTVRKGVIWELSFPTALDQATTHAQAQQILQTHLLYNPYSQECYLYD